MAESMWISIISQIPVVAAFMLFMLIWQKRQHEAGNADRESWQSWLDRLIENNRIERETWRRWLTERDATNVMALSKLASLVRQQSSVILAMLAREGGDVDKIIDALEKLNTPTNNDFER